MAAASLSAKLSTGQALLDLDIQRYLDEVDCQAASSICASPCGAARLGNGDMRLPREQQTIQFSDSGCKPANFSLRPGGAVVISVQSGPSQVFSLGRDEEEAIVTPAIPAGASYEWTPPTPGRYFVKSEVYPHLRSSIKALTQQEAEAAAAAAGTNTSSIGGSVCSSARSSLAGQLNGGLSSSSIRTRGARSSSTHSEGHMAAVDEPISFPALRSLASAQPAGSGCVTLSRSTQTGGITSSVSRFTSTGSTSPAAGIGPGPVLGRFQAPAAAADGSDTEELSSLLDSPPESGLRRRGRGAGAQLPATLPAPVPAATEAGAAVPSSRSAPTVLPELSRPFPVAGVDGFSVLSSGSGGSPRSGSGSERSAASAPLYVHRRALGGSLATRVYPPMGHSSTGAYNSHDSRSSEEAQPLLYSVGSRGQQHLQGSSYSSSGGAGAGAFRPYSPTAHHHQQHQQAQREARPAMLHKCPRCRKEYLSTINQRRCISSHLGASGKGSSARGSTASSSSLDEKKLAEFWDQLGEGEKRGVMEGVSSEPFGGDLIRKLEAQLLHRMRAGAMDGLSQEQKRMHLAGRMLHQFCTRKVLGAAPGAADAPTSFSGSNLVSVLNKVSEGTFLYDRNTINRAEFFTGDNLEAGLGALVAQRLVEAHLAAKSCAAARMQRELEDLEAAQAVQQKSKQQQQQSQQQQAGAQQQKAPAAKKAAKGSKAKPGKAAGPAVAASKPAGKAVAAADAAPLLDEMPAQGGAPAPAAAAAMAAGQSQEQQPAAANGVQVAAQEGPDDALSPPSAGARYGSSPQKPEAVAGGRSSFTNVLFAEDGKEAGPGGDGSAEEDDNGWRTAGSGRPSSRTSQHGAAKPAHGSGSAASGLKRSGSSGAGGSSRGTASNGAVSSSKAGSRSNVSTERPASRTGDRAAANGRHAAAASAVPKNAAPKAAGAAVAATNGKLPAAATTAAPASRNPAPASLAGGKQGQQQPHNDGFPSLPAAAGAKQAPAAAASSGVSYAAAVAAAAASAKAQKGGITGSRTAAANPDQPAALAPQQKQQLVGAPASSLAKQPKSWPVPASGTAGKTVSAAEAVQASLPGAQPEANNEAASTPPAAAAEPSAAGNAACAAVGEPPSVAPATEAAVPAAVPEMAAAVEAQRCASVTPPISDAGSPPPGSFMTLPPGAAFPVPPGPWVAPDGSVMPPLPMGYYWGMVPPPGMQFGSVDMVEVVPPEALPPAPYPYAFYHPGLFQLPPGMLPPGMPHQHLPYGGDGQLAPFPPGMPMPLPPELAAAAAAAQAAGEEELEGWTAAADGAQSEAAPAELMQPPEQGQQPQPAAAAAAVVQQQTSPAAARRGFLALLQEAGVALAPHTQPGAASSGSSGGSGAKRQPAFDTTAAAAELERRWQSSAGQAVPANSLLVGSPQQQQALQQQQESKPAAAAPAAAPRGKPTGTASRSSSGSLPASKAAKGSSGPIGASPSSSSGRSSPATCSNGTTGGVTKPVVVAVRAWSSSDDSVSSDAPKWKISTGR